MSSRKIAEEKTEEIAPISVDKGDWFWIEGKEQTEAQFCAWANAFVQDHPVVRQHHGKWQELIAWEEGDQYTLWNSDAKRVAPVDLTRKKRVVINFMKPLIEAIDGKVNFFNSVIGVPNSSEQKDINGSIVATKILAHNDVIVGIDGVTEDMKYDMYRTGTGCIRWFWDESLSGFGQVEKGKAARRVEGDVGCYSPDIFNLRPDPAAKRPDQLRWMFEIKEISVDDFLSTYGDKVEEEWLKKQIESDPAKKYMGTNEDLSEKHRDMPTVVILEFIEKPSNKYPQGRFIVVLADKAVEAGPNTNADNDLGYFFYYYRKNRRSFWGRGPLYYVQPIQKEFNRMVSMESEHYEAWRPKMMVPMGSLARASSMIAGSLELVEIPFDRGARPEPVQMPQLSSGQKEYRDFLLAAKDMVSNIHEPSYAQLPKYSSQSPNSLYQSMLEQEAVKLDPMVKRTNKTILAQSRFRLKLMAKHYGERRLVKIMGPNKIAATRYFSAIDLNQNYDVQLEIGVSINQSTTVLGRLVLDLWDKKFFDTSDRPKILKLLNLGTAEAEFRGDIADLERACRENQSFIDGTWMGVKGKSRPIWVFVHDDHEVHLEQHTNLYKSEEVETWPDEQVQALEDHIEKHFEFYLKLAEASKAMEAGPTSETGQAAASPEDEYAQEELERGGGGEGAEPLPVV